MSATTWNVVLGGLIAIVSAWGAQTIFLWVQGSREQQAYRRRLKGERRDRLLNEYAAIDAAALDLFRLARDEFELLKEQQARVSPWPIVRRFHHAIPVPRALAWQQKTNTLIQPLQERMTDLKRSVSLVRLDSQELDIGKWEEFVSAFNDFNDRFVAIVPGNLQVEGSVEDMEQKLTGLRRLYGDLFAAMRRELDALEGE